MHLGRFRSRIIRFGRRQGHLRWRNGDVIEVTCAHTEGMTQARRYKRLVGAQPSCAWPARHGHAVRFGGRGPGAVPNENGTTASKLLSSPRQHSNGERHHVWGILRRPNSTPHPARRSATRPIKFPQAVVWLGGVVQCAVAGAVAARLLAPGWAAAFELSARLQAEPPGHLARVQRNDAHSHSPRRRSHRAGRELRSSVARREGHGSMRIPSELFRMHAAALRDGSGRRAAKSGPWCRVASASSCNAGRGLCQWSSGCLDRRRPLHIHS